MDRDCPTLNNTDSYRRGARLLSPIPLTWQMVFYVAPLATMLGRFLSWTTLVDVLTDRSIRTILWFTTWQAFASATLTVIVAWPVTWATSRYTFGGRRLVRGIVTAPFVLPTVVVAASMRAVLPDSLRSGTIAIVLAHVLFNVAVVVRIVGARWESESTHLCDTARVLGMSPFRSFATFTWPRIRGAVVAAFGVVFVFCFTSFGVVRILGGSQQSTLEVEIFFRAVQLGAIDEAVVLSVLQIVAILAVFVLVAPRSDYVPTFSRLQAVPANNFPRRRRVVIVTCLVTALAVLAPFMTMFAKSLRSRSGWTIHAWTRLFDGSLAGVGVDVASATINSLLYAVVTVALALPLALIVASLIAYSRTNDRLARLVEVLATVPLATSAVALGLGVVITFDAAPIDWRNSWWMLPMSYTVIALPLMVRTLVPPLRSIPATWRDKAATLGSSPARTWWAVDVASIRRPIALAVGLCAAVSLGEFGLTSFLTRSGHDTLPVAIARLLSRPGDILQSSGYALACMMVAVVVSVMSRA